MLRLSPVVVCPGDTDQPEEPVEDPVLAPTDPVLAPTDPVLAPTDPVLAPTDVVPGRWGRGTELVSVVAPAGRTSSAASAMIIPAKNSDFLTAGTSLSHRRDASVIRTHFNL